MNSLNVLMYHISLFLISMSEAVNVSRLIRRQNNDWIIYMYKVQKYINNNGWVHFSIRKDTNIILNPHFGD